MNKLTVGDLVRIVKHGILDGDPDTHLSNYESYKVGTEHTITEVTPCRTSVILDNDIAVNLEEIEYVSSASAEA